MRRHPQDARLRAPKKDPLATLATHFLGLSLLQFSSSPALRSCICVFSISMVYQYLCVVVCPVYVLCVCVCICTVRKARKSKVFALQTTTNKTLSNLAQLQKGGASTVLPSGITLGPNALHTVQFSLVFRRRST